MYIIRIIYAYSHTYIILNTGTITLFKLFHDKYDRIKFLNLIVCKTITMLLNVTMYITYTILIFANLSLHYFHY